MLPFGIGFGEIVLIGIVLLLVVGPHKLPDLAKTIGKGLRVVRKAGNELRDAMDFDEVRDVKRELYRPLTDWRDSEPEDVVAEPVKPGRTPKVQASEFVEADDAPHEALEHANADPGPPAGDDGEVDGDEAEGDGAQGPQTVAQHDPFYHKLKRELAKAEAEIEPTAGDVDAQPPKPEGTDGSA